MVVCVMLSLCVSVVVFLWVFVCSSRMRWWLRLLGGVFDVDLGCICDLFIMVKYCDEMLNMKCVLLEECFFLLWVLFKVLVNDNF